MTPAIIIELGYRGVHIPPDARSARVPCPQCSPYRAPKPHWGNRDYKPLAVHVHSLTEAHVRCWKCGDGWERITA